MIGVAVANANPYPLGQYYNSVGPVFPYSSTAGFNPVVPSSIVGTKKVIVIIGDSIPANSGPTLYTITQSKNYQVNVLNGAIYQASDPAFSASNGYAAPYFSSVAGPLGDNIITGTYATNAIILDNGMGSAVVADWAVGGGLNQNIGTIAARLSNLGLTPDAWIWHAGPNDTNVGTSQGAYTASLNSVISTIRGYYASVPILVGVCSYNGVTTSANVTNAQTAAPSAPSKIYAGVNSDAFPGADFATGGHFAPAGRTAWAAGYITQLAAAGAI